MLELETREWIAYGLIAVMLVTGAISGAIFHRRRQRRKLRLAGDASVKRLDAKRP